MFFGMSASNFLPSTLFDAAQYVANTCILSWIHGLIDYRYYDFRTIRHTDNQTQMTFKVAFEVKFAKTIG